MKKYNPLNNLSIRRLFFVINVGTIALLTILCALIVYIVSLENNLSVMHENRFRSYLLAAELRQSSDDLTRFARTYSITHDPKYQNFYNDIIAVRNGIKARPEAYHRIYWDFMAWNGKKPRPDENRSISLQKLMEEAGFSKEEFNKLKEAEKISNELFQIEKTAIDIANKFVANASNSMLAMPMLAADTAALKMDTSKNMLGNFMLPAIATTATATDSSSKLVHDENYHSLKAKAMKPIDEFFQLFEERTLKAISEQQNKIYVWVVLLYILISIVISVNIFSYLIIKSKVTAPIEKIKDNLFSLSKGIIPKDKTIVLENNEIGHMTIALNTYLDGLIETAEFATRIGKGDLNAKFKPLSEEDELGTALLEMQSSLQKAEEEDNKRTIEEQQRNWTTQGLAKFGDILRQSTENIKDLGYNVISNLVAYLNANLGGIFIYNDDSKDDIHLELLAAYAYDRRKYLQKKIYLKEGLIGTCAVEKRTMFLTKLPENYIEITSGLGDSAPRCLLIVPLIREKAILGVIEVASFNIFQKFEIEFVERLAETVAATLDSAKINSRTAELLRQSQQQAEAMAAQEEEMRQNMEELQATQEEAARKEATASSFVSAVNSSIIRADFDLDGHFTYTNHRFLDLMGYSHNELEGKQFILFLFDDAIGDFELNWQKIVTGDHHYETEINVKTKFDTVWLLATFTPVRDKEGFIKEILMLAYNITDSKRHSLEISQQLEESQK